MSDTNYSEISKGGLWTNNVVLVQLLGLCPLLAVTGTVINGLGLGLATLITLVASNVIVSLIRNWVRPEVRVPVFVMIIASVVTTIEFTMNAWFYDLYKILGIFIPLIVTNCSILARAEAFASKNRMLPSALDGFMMGLGFTGVLVLLGAMREAIGHGTLLADAHLMFGDMASNWTIVLFDDYSGMLLAILPPGAFIGLGLIIATKNMFEKKLQKPRSKAAVPARSKASI